MFKTKNMGLFSNVRIFEPVKSHIYEPNIGLIQELTQKPVLGGGGDDSRNLQCGCHPFFFRLVLTGVGGPGSATVINLILPDIQLYKIRLF